MGWLKKDDRFPEHRKIRRLNDGAYRLHDTALHACAKDETDGLVTEEDIADMEHGRRLRKHVPTLVKAGLWHEVEGGWEINDFLDYNPSHAQQEEKRRLARERQAKWRKGGGGGDVTDVSQRDSDVTNASLTRTSHSPVPTRPDPSRPDPISSGHLGNEGGSKRRASTQCPHGRDVNSACGACADARRETKRADADELAAKRNREQAERDAKAARTAAGIAACHACDDKGYLPSGKVCPTNDDGSHYYATEEA